jgi:hypothetical protein
MNTPATNRYKNHRFPAEIISHVEIVGDRSVHLGALGMALALAVTDAQAYPSRHQARGLSPRQAPPSGRGSTPSAHSAHVVSRTS